MSLQPKSQNAALYGDDLMYRVYATAEKFYDRGAKREVLRKFVQELRPALSTSKNPSILLVGSGRGEYVEILKELLDDPVIVCLDLYQKPEKEFDNLHFIRHDFMSESILPVHKDWDICEIKPASAVIFTSCFAEAEMTQLGSGFRATDILSFMLNKIKSSPYLMFAPVLMDFTDFHAGRVSAGSLGTFTERVPIAGSKLEGVVLDGLKLLPDMRATLHAGDTLVIRSHVTKDPYNANYAVRKLSYMAELDGKEYPLHPEHRVIELRECGYWLTDLYMAGDLSGYRVEDPHPINIDGSCICQAVVFHPTSVGN